MTKRMLIDATHAEETRVVVLDGNRLEDFDVETSTKKQLKGNIYLAKVVRVEPSLQAAFVEYGGNRHGFLAFSEIHPDYYQIPVADRQRLLDMQAEEARREEEEEERELLRHPIADSSLPRSEADEPSGESIELSGDDDLAEADGATQSPVSLSPGAQPLAIHTDRVSGPIEGTETEPEFDAAPDAGANGLEPPVGQAPTSALPDHDAPAQEAPSPDVPAGEAAAVAESASSATRGDDASAIDSAAEEPLEAAYIGGEARDATADAPANVHDEPASPEPHLLIVPAPEGEPAEQGPAAHASADGMPAGNEPDPADPDDDDEVGGEISPPPETVGGDVEADERAERRLASRYMRSYKIQEVIKRRQILLVQVVKEERGTKGAALTTYLSLAGRFGVLMPNSPRGGGISRKITSATDRRRLKEVMTELDIPKGMGLIVRTAGANRPKPEIKRDCEYLLRLWDDIREHTLRSVAPALIYEEASLIKRSIRDVYSRDIDEILVDGEDGWKAARDFMRMLMPTHARKVQLWRDTTSAGGQPLFARNQVEQQLDGMLQPTVQLRSGGYLVINQTEALVAIDVNSGRSTRERGIEETALRTNLEAADEVARQLRLRDLAGLIVIDFIDMEAKKHNAMVERRMKEALKNDRARIQLGHISHFGLLEMSRQRLRPSLAETSFILCPHCGGTGHVRSTESAAIHVLRGIEDEGAKRRAAEIVVYVATPVALYIFNHKRDRVREIEARYGLRINFANDDTENAPTYRIEKVRALAPSDLPAAVTPDALPAPAGTAAFASNGAGPAAAVEAAEIEDDDEDLAEGDEEDGDEAEDAAQAEAGETAEESERRRRRRRRRRRGGRREENGAPVAPAEAAEPVSEQEAADTHIEGVPEHAEAGAEDGDPNGDEARGRRRGRRGGRRRRREGGETGLPPAALPGAEQPELPPVYTGPTPANPFGGHTFDIFDVLEQAEETAAFPHEAYPAKAALPADDFSEHLVEAVVTIEPPAPPASAITAVELPMMVPADLPAAVEVETPQPSAAAEPEPPAPANDQAPGPLVKPILIGSDDTPAADKKRGWWRR
jgi:ribonuclease E